MIARIQSTHTNIMTVHSSTISTYIIEFQIRMHIIDTWRNKKRERTKHLWLINNIPITIFHLFSTQRPLFKSPLTIVHNRSGDILSGDSLVPSCLHVQVQSHLASVLSRVQQIPLELEVGVRGYVGGVAQLLGCCLVHVIVVAVRWHWDGTQTSLHTHKARLLDGQMDLMDRG